MGLGRQDFSGKKLAPQEADQVVADLKKYLADIAERWLIRGRFHTDMANGTLPMEAIQVFWQNWYGFVAEINNFHGVAYQRHLPFFKRHPELQKHFANHVADEMIHPKPPGHIQIVLEQGRNFGLTNDQMIEYEMLPECRAFLEYYRGVLYEGTMVEWWASFCVEEAVGHWAKFFGGTLRKNFNIPEDRLLPHARAGRSRRARRRDGARRPGLDGSEKIARRRQSRHPAGIQFRILPAHRHSLFCLVLRGRLPIRKKGRILQSLIMGETNNEELSPRRLMRILGDFANSQILDASIEYDFFTLIHKGLQSAEEIARAAGTDARATRIVLDSLPALGLIEKRGGKYFLTPTAEVFLVKEKPSYVGDFRHVALALWDGMAHLKESLKTGKPLSRMDTGAELQVWEKLVLGIIVIAEPAAKALCDILKIGSERKGIQVLDIAGGSSIFGMTILSRDPSAQVTQLDWPNVNAVAKKANKERGLDGKIRFIDGEHHTAPIETNYYDLVLASNFCRFESPRGNQELFAKAYSALKPGGIFVVNDFVPNEERTEPTFALRFSVYTLTHTPEGECWTLSQYSEWLQKAGFKSIEIHGDIPKTLPGTTLIVAKK